MLKILFKNFNAHLDKLSEERTGRDKNRFSRYCVNSIEVMLLHFPNNLTDQQIHHLTWAATQQLFNKINLSKSKMNINGENRSMKKMIIATIAKIDLPRNTTLCLGPIPLPVPQATIRQFRIKHYSNLYTNNNITVSNKLKTLFDHQQTQIETLETALKDFSGSTDEKNIYLNTEFLKIFQHILLEFALLLLPEKPLDLCTLSWFAACKGMHLFSYNAVNKNNFFNQLTVTSLPETKEAAENRLKAETNNHILSS